MNTDTSLTRPAPAGVWRRLVLASCLALLGACSTTPGEGEAYNTWMRATDAMAPPNPARGARTLRVTTLVPPELEVRLMTFYSQFHPPRGADTRSLPRSGQLAPGCWRSRTSLLQEERDYYTRVFHHPVAPGTSTQDVVLDDVLSGTCHVGLTGLGYEVTLKGLDGSAVRRYRVSLDIGVEEGGAPSAQAVVRCGVVTAAESGKRLLHCARDDRREQWVAGPLAPAGAALTLDFRWVPELPR